MTLQELVSSFAGIDNIEDANYIVENNKVELVVPSTDDSEYSKVVEVLKQLGIKLRREYTFKDGGDKYSVAVVRWNELNEHLNFN